MVFARLRKRFAEQDWFAVAIELAIVGVGVFLGMQATSWNEDRLDRARAASYRTRLIGPPALRERLANFYWRMDGLLPQATAPVQYRVRARGLIPYEVQVAIRARCDDVVSDDGHGLVTIRLPRDCPIALPAAQVGMGVAALRAVPGLKADLTGALTDFDAKLLNFGKLEASAREMRAILERANR